MSSPDEMSTVSVDVAREQWEHGDWDALAEISEEALSQCAERAEVALYSTAASLQIGRQDSAKQRLNLALDWGCDAQQIRRFLASGAYNSLARAHLVGGREREAGRLMRKSCATVKPPATDAGDMAAARFAKQAFALSTGESGVFSAVDALPDATATPPEPFADLRRILHRVTGNVLTHGRDLVLDGVRVFEQKDPFLAGKLALAFAYRVVEAGQDSHATIERCREFEQVSHLVRAHKNDTWGSFFHLLALVKLHDHGVLERALPQYRVDELRDQLDWRTFVNEEDYQLRGKPNNFYGVAYGIAQMRARLGWDDPQHGEALLQCMVDHFKAHSGDYGFADETEGEGRYDRYSILLIAELAHRHREAGLAFPEPLRTWLRRSADVVLVNLNEGGHGFQFGRSIGAYGDSAFVEILTAAAWHGVLSPVETRMAYTFSLRATDKFLKFWYDESREAVNLWEDGRRTEAYRGKHRILGETLSLLHHHLYTHEVWQQLGYGPEIVSTNDFSAWLNELPRYTLTRFSETDYAQAMLTVRDGGHVFSLWFVNGGQYHDRNAYFPVPFAHGLIQSVPDETFPQLVPQLELDDGTLLMPLAFTRAITLDEQGPSARLTCEQDALDTLGGEKPAPDHRASVTTHFDFAPGSITRTDHFELSPSTRLRRIRMEYASRAAVEARDSSEANAAADGVALNADGYGRGATYQTDGNPKYFAPDGPLTVTCVWENEESPSGLPMTVSWTINY